MGTKHTPGPWTAEGRGGTHDGGSSIQHPCFRGNITAKNGQSIVSQGSFLGIKGKTPKEAEANARLISAAPELLETILMMKRAFRENRPLTIDEFKQIQAAIAKAGA